MCWKSFLNYYLSFGVDCILAVQWNARRGYFLEVEIEVEVTQGQTTHLDKEILPAKRHESGVKKKREKEAQLLAASAEKWDHSLRFSEWKKKVELMLRLLGNVLVQSRL